MNDSGFDSLLYPAFYEECSFVVQDIVAPLVDGAEDGPSALGIESIER